MSAEPQSAVLSTDQAPDASSLSSRRGVAILLLLSRRRVLVTGLVVFAGSSLIGGLAHTESLLIGARFAQGLGAAMLSPAALSTLTSTFRAARDRNTALGVWAAVSGIGGAAGVLFGGLLTEGPGWRWVLFVNVPFSAVAFVGAFALLKGDRVRARLAGFDALGAFLVTGGMLLLVYWLSRIPIDGSYVSDIMPGLLVVSLGMGGVFTGLTTAANAGVEQEKAGLAAGLLNTGQQLGTALGLAILSALATARTTSLLHGHASVAQAATGGYQHALMIGAFFVLAAGAVALLARNTRQTTSVVDAEHAQGPALDLAA